MGVDVEGDEGCFEIGRGRGGAVVGDELALQRRLLFKEEALALVDARRVGLAIDELAVELAAEQVDFGARTMFCVHKLALLPHQAALHAR